jgi:SAM-dependent methyltransferase
MSLPVPIPTPPGYRDTPIWTGNGFAVGGQSIQRILSYQSNYAGWTNELTEIHEDSGDQYHYINVASREHTAGTLAKWLPGGAPSIIDIGCSSGYMIRLLRQRLPAATVLAADCVRGPLEKLANAVPDVPLLEFDLVQCPLPDQCVDGVVLLNVLEHVKEDAAALHQVHRILKKGGVAVIELPAGPDLYDIYDQELMHFRRYRMADVVRLCEQTGFEILERSHLGFFLYPAFRLVKKKNQKYLNASPEIRRAVVARNMRQGANHALLHTLMRVEALLRKWIYFPFGIRCLVTCRRR